MSVYRSHPLCFSRSSLQLSNAKIFRNQKPFNHFPAYSASIGICGAESLFTVETKEVQHGGVVMGSISKCQRLCSFGNILLFEGTDECIFPTLKCFNRYISGHDSVIHKFKVFFVYVFAFMLKTKYRPICNVDVFFLTFEDRGISYGIFCQ